MKYDAKVKYYWVLKEHYNNLIEEHHAKADNDYVLRVKKILNSIEVDILVEMEEYYGQFK